MTTIMTWDERFGYDRCPEAIRRTHDGMLELVDSVSDDAEIVDHIRNHRPEMRFRLTFDGSLKSGSNDARKKEKWDIRRWVEPQLAELWTVHPALQGHQMAYKGSWEKLRANLISDQLGKPFDDADAIALNRARLVAPIEVGGYQFLPLVRKSLDLTCSLDILFLRKDFPGSIYTEGDIDNRLKTLFDGLAMPSDANQFIEREIVEPQPFHCLLENDKLISSLTVRTDRLLSRPGAPRDEVRLIIDVVISPTRIGLTSNSGFLGDY